MTATAAVRRQLAELTSLLTAQQDQALRNLLQGLIAQEVSRKLHAARELVELMNKRLAAVSTAHGISAKLRWTRRDDLDEGLRAIVELMAKLPDLRSEEEDATLAAALSTRLDDARLRRAAMAKPLDVPATRKFLMYYDRLRKSRWPVLIRLDAGVCTGCHMQLPPAKQQDAMKNAVTATDPAKMAIVACDFCGRMIH